MNLSTDENRDERDIFSWSTIALIFLSVLTVGLLIGIVPWVMFSLFPEWAKAFPDKAGLWGDSFGFVNALLSALAFAGVLVTLWMQRRELRLQRDELVATRKQHERMAKAQEESENQLFLTAYMNAVDSLRQLGQWRMSPPPNANSPSYPMVHGFVIQERVIQTLHGLVEELEPQIGKIHSQLGRISEEGSHVWRLEGLLSIFLSLREVIDRYDGRTDDVEVCREAVSVIELQLQKLRTLREHLGLSGQQQIDSILSKAPSIQWLAGDIFADSSEAREQRRNILASLPATNSAILQVAMSMCHR